MKPETKRGPKRSQAKLSSPAPSSSSRGTSSRSAAKKRSGPKTQNSKHASETLLAHLREMVESAVGMLPGVERRRMLVSPGWFVAGKSFTFVARHGRIIVRIADEVAQNELLARDGAARWQYGNKPPLRDWFELPESMHDDLDELRTWLTRAHALGTRKRPTATKKTAKAAARKKTASRASRRA